VTHFNIFLKLNGIFHLVGTPYHPQSNGAAESAVKIIKNFIKKATNENTPHTTTGEIPAKILLGRPVIPSWVNFYPI